MMEKATVEKQIKAMRNGIFPEEGIPSHRIEWWLGWLKGYESLEAELAEVKEERDKLREDIECAADWLRLEERPPTIIEISNCLKELDGALEADKGKSKPTEADVRRQPK